VSEVGAHEVNPGVLRDLAVMTRDGKKAGTVSGLLYDSTGREPRWAVVQSGLLGSRETLVPLQDAKVAGRELRVRYRKARLETAPWEPAPELAPEAELALCRHYDITYDGDVTQDGAISHDGVLPREQAAPTGAPAPEPEGPLEVTRSEERMRVRIERTSKKMMVRRRIVTEMRQITVAVSREELEFVPVTEEQVVSSGGGRLTSLDGEQEIEFVLHEERPVVTMQTVPVERVRVTKRLVTEQQAVGAEIRKEVVEVDEPRP